MDKKQKKDKPDINDRELLSKRVVDEDEEGQEEDSLKDWNPADAPLDALPPVNELVDVILHFDRSLTWSSSSKTHLNVSLTRS